MRVRDGIVTRLLHVDEQPIVVNAWQRRDGLIALRATAADGVGEAAMERAIQRMRFALGVDEDLRPFYERFRNDPLVGPAIRRRPWVRPRRRPSPWEALASAITAQLIESGRALAIQRRMIHRWAPRMDRFRDFPGASVIAERAPAELAGCDLAPARAIAMIRCAQEVVSGRVDLSSAEDDRRLLAIREIGPWTVQCLGLNGRGDPDSLPAGDLAYVKLVGRLRGMRRRATVEEVEDFFAPYEPYRGLAGTFAAVHWHKALPAGSRLRIAA
jgi:3-methyladenine DNA glycosylase/8-oxoguanine DNA glycosylase